MQLKGLLLALVAILTISLDSRNISVEPAWASMNARIEYLWRDAAAASLRSKETGDGFGGRLVLRPLQQARCA